MVTHSHQIAALADTVLTIHERKLVVEAGVKRNEAK
jgi:ABC-type lipoprotein export system ATPase subunit